MLVELEENQKLLERLEIESPAKGKSGAANSSDKKSAKQMVVNPAIQQPSSCPVCGLNLDISQCKKEEARLYTEATKRGEKFPGANKPASGNSPRQKQECEEKTDQHYGSSSGCFMCLAPGNPRWAYHIHTKRWSKDNFDKLLQDLETF